jgi:hypothetical protein
VRGWHSPVVHAEAAITSYEARALIERYSLSGVCSDYEPLRRDAVHHTTLGLICQRCGTSEYRHDLKRLLEHVRVIA